MAAITIESLRSELEKFAKDAMHRELMAMRESLLTEIRGMPQNTSSSSRVDSAGAKYTPPAPVLEQAPSTSRRSSRGLQLAENSGAIAISSPRNQEQEHLLSARPSLLLRARPSLRRPPSDTPWLTQIVLGSAFSNFISLVIVLNMVVFGIQTDYMARHWSTESTPVFQALEYAFCAVFTTEVALRIYVTGPSFFKQFQNLFDFSLVSMQLAEAVMSLVTGSHSSSLTMSSLRALRIARVARVTRVLHLVPDFQMLVVSISSSMQSLCWVFLLVMMVTYVFGIVLTQIVTEHKVGVGRGDMEEQKELEEYYGSLDRSMVMLYETISEGIHWSELADPLTEFCSPWMMLVFIFYTAFITFALMNIVTSFFVETAMRVAKDDFKAKTLKSLWELFQDTDDDHNRVITNSEFLACFEKPQMIEFLKKLELPPDRVSGNHFFQLIDKDKSGGIDVDELISGCLRLMGDATAFDLATLSLDFRNEVKANRVQQEAMTATLSKILGWIENIDEERFSI